MCTPQLRGKWQQINLAGETALWFKLRGCAMMPEVSRRHFPPIWMQPYYTIKPLHGSGAWQNIHIQFGTPVRGDT